MRITFDNTHVAITVRGITMHASGGTLAMGNVLSLTFGLSGVTIKNGDKTTLLMGSGTLVIDEADDHGIPMPELPPNWLFIHQPGQQLGIASN